MYKIIPIIVALSALSLGACSPQQRLMDKRSGAAERTETHTDDAGTITTKTTTTDVMVDEYGKRMVTVNTKTTTDPKGLMNKTTTNETSTTTKQ